MPRLESGHSAVVREAWCTQRRRECGALRIRSAARLRKWMARAACRVVGIITIDQAHTGHAADIASVVS